MKFLNSELSTDDSANVTVRIIFKIHSKLKTWRNERMDYIVLTTELVRYFIDSRWMKKQADYLEYKTVTNVVRYFSLPWTNLNIYLKIILLLLVWWKPILILAGIEIKELDESFRRAFLLFPAHNSTTTIVIITNLETQGLTFRQNYNKYHIVKLGHTNVSWKSEIKFQSLNRK